MNKLVDLEGYGQTVVQGYQSNRSPITRTAHMLIDSILRLVPEHAELEKNDGVFSHGTQ